MPQSKKKVPKRIRSKTSRCRFDKTKIEKEITTASIEKTGLSDRKIECFLSNTPNFLGCFAQDQLRHLKIYSHPVYLIVNFDNSYSVGSHWVAIRIDKNRLEIFDSLGFNSLRWPKFPNFLLDFLNKYSHNRSIHISKEIQSYDSTLCGFYCIYFVLYRATNTFRDCNKLFSNQLYKNDKILLTFFNKL